MIDIKKAKVKFLSLAFQGALVDYPNKEKSNEALNAIHSKQKGFAPVETEEFLIVAPSYWNWSRLGYITKNHGQIVPDTDFCYIDVGTLDNVHQRLAEKENLVNAKDAPSRARKIVQFGDVLYSTVRPYLHNICVIDKNFSRTPIASTAFCVMQANESVLLNKYLFYWLLTSEFDKYSNGDPSKGALYPAIGEKDLLRGVIPLPSVDEQRLIVEKIEQTFSVLDTIDELQAKYADNPTALKSKLTDLAIRGKLTEQLPEDGTAEELYQRIQAEKQILIKEGKIKKEKPFPEIKADEMPFEIPVTWKWIRWGELSNQIQYGYNAPAKETGRIRMVRITDIQGNHVNWTSVPFCDIDEEDIEGYRLHPNDILFARTGGTVGKSYLVGEVEEDAVFAGYLIRTSYSNDLNAKYMKYFMESRLYWKQLQDGTTATAQPNCNAKTLSKMMLPLPPKLEQDRIVSRLDVLNQLIDSSSVR